ncbi:MAG: G5 domain-containing protein [Actinomycetota bacterium]|nr:G5 domain-containing protein [Actinomycetota bacterium]
MHASPARARAADPQAWLPVPDVDTLPALEELLDDDRLVSSGQTQAITDTQPTPVVSPEERWAAFRARVPPPNRARRRRRRLLGIALALVTIAALAFVVPELLAQSPHVTIRTDGAEKVSADTDATTVRSALREEGVKLGAEDRVTPGLGAKVSDGLAINVFRPLPVAVDFDGDLRSVDTTWRKPAQLVQQLHLDPKRISIVTAPTRLTAGSLVGLRTSREVTISVDGTQNTEKTAALNVGEFLQQNGVVLGFGDQPTPAAETRLTDGLTVSVARTVTDTAQADEPLAPPEIRQNDPSLPKGQMREIQAGVAGVQRVTYEINRERGQEVARAPISKVPIQPPVPRVIAVGTVVPKSRTGSA